MTDFGPLEERIEGLRKRIERLEIVNRLSIEEYKFENCQIGDIVEARDSTDLYKVAKFTEGLYSDCIELENFNTKSKLFVYKSDFKRWIKLIKRWGQ